MEERAKPSPFRYDKVEWEFGVHPVVMSLYEVCSEQSVIYRQPCAPFRGLGALYTI